MDETLTVPHITRVTNRDYYCTPPELYRQLNDIFNFDNDMAATKENTLALGYFGDSLIHCWMYLGAMLRFYIEWK